MFWGVHRLVNMGTKLVGRHQSVSGECVMISAMHLVGLPVLGSPLIFHGPSHPICLVPKFAHRRMACNMAVIVEAVPDLVLHKMLFSFKY